MEMEQFQKQKLNSDDYRAIENGAKALKGATATLIAAVTVMANKDNLKTLGKTIRKTVTKMIGR